ncbi:MAG: hypothetical protein JWQ72_2201 [Polaromonas sp.]|nr:hypothetical protein [Polaromonas sp.]
MRTTITRLAVTIGVAVTMLACATTSSAQQSAALLSQSHGYVVVALPRLLGVAAADVTLRPVGGGTDYDLVPTAANSEVLALWVPPGQYEITQMVGPTKGKYDPIEVKAGQVTNLGGIAWAGIGNNERVLLPLRHEDLAAAVTAAAESLKELPVGERIEWKPTAPPLVQAVPTSNAMPGSGLLVYAIEAYIDHANKTPLRTQLRSAKSLDEFTKMYLPSAAPVQGGSGVGDANAVYLGGNFGYLRKRDAAGAWRSIDTGTMSPLTAVEAAGNRVIVGTHDGLLLTSADNAQTWSRLHQFDKKENVLNIHLAGNQYFVLTGKFVGVATGRTAAIESLQVYVLDLPTLAPKLLRKIDLPTKLNSFQMTSLQASLAGNYYLVNTLESIERFDLTMRTWKKVSAPHGVTHLRSAKNGAILTAFKAQGGFSKLSVSTDFGDSWKAMETPPYPVNDIQMESTEAGYASRWDTGAFASAMQLTQYDPASRSWKQTWTAPVATCIRTLRDASGKEQLCVTGGGSIFSIGSGKLVPEFLAD